MAQWAEYLTGAGKGQLVQLPEHRACSSGGSARHRVPRAMASQVAVPSADRPGFGHIVSTPERLAQRRPPATASQSSLGAKSAVRRFLSTAGAIGPCGGNAPHGTAIAHGRASRRADEGQLDRSAAAAVAAEPEPVTRRGEFHIIGDPDLIEA